MKTELKTKKIIPLTLQGVMSSTMSNPLKARRERSTLKYAVADGCRAKAKDKKDKIE